MPNTKIVFLVFPKVNLLDLAGAGQVFHEAMEQGADLTIEYCSIEEQIATSSHLHLQKLKHFSKVKLRKGDYLIIPGGEVSFFFSPRLAAVKGLANWVKDAYKTGANICSVCTAAFFLAMHGLLDNKKCTTHWSRTAELQKKYPAVNLVENILFTEDNGIYTSAGVTAGIDMALYIVSKLTDDHFSYNIARELVVYMRRQANDSQQSIFMRFRNHIHSGIHSVQNYLQDNTQEKTSLTQLAGIACMSARNLTRVFKKETGISVNGYITLVRKTYIHELLKNPDITRKEIAKQCGLKSERQVIRLINTMQDT